MGYISEQCSNFKYELGKFNIIASGTGTGKSKYIREHLLESFPEINPSEVLYVTSRAMVCDQQAKEKPMARFRSSVSHSTGIAGVWNGDDQSADPSDVGDYIWIMNYPQLAEFIDKPMANGESAFVFKNIRVIVLDECHSLYTDRYIDKMATIRCWIRERIWRGDVCVIGMTATSGIVEHYAFLSSFKVNVVNDGNYIVNHKAAHVICTRYEHVASLLMSGELKGRTMVMLPSIEDGAKMVEVVPNAFLLVSMSNTKYVTREMVAVRNYIIINETLPFKLSDACNWIEQGSEEDKRIDVLVTTSTMREGIDIHEQSNVRNIICCIPDPIHVIQFAGRCRYSIDCLVVTNYPFKAFAKLDYTDYVNKSRAAFSRMVNEKKANEWFNSISNTVAVEKDDVEFYTPADENLFFYEALDVMLDKNAGRIELFGAEAKKDFVSFAERYRALDLPKSRYTFQKVKRVVDDSDDFVIEHKYRYVDNGGTKEYYYIITRRAK